jgi:hypothetical protein
MGWGMRRAWNAAYMSDTVPVVTKEDDVWVIRLQTEAGKLQEYRCASETQARQLALVLTPKAQK